MEDIHYRKKNETRPIKNLISEDQLNKIKKDYYEITPSKLKVLTDKIYKILKLKNKKSQGK